MKWLCTALLITLLSTGITFAQEPTTPGENDPNTNLSANACFVGGALAGKCAATDLDKDGQIAQWEIAYMYTGGWYLIRFQAGIYTRREVPLLYHWMLPPELPLPLSSDVLAGADETSCIIYLTGPIVGAPTTLIAPLEVIIGGVDPNGIPNSPYGFDWGSTGRLNIAVPGGGFVVYGLVPGQWYAPHVAATTCPTPIAP
jgi:hypothetical protein